MLQFSVELVYKVTKTTNISTGGRMLIAGLDGLLHKSKTV